MNERDGKWINVRCQSRMKTVKEAQKIKKKNYVEYLATKMRSRKIKIYTYTDIFVMG